MKKVKSLLITTIIAVCAAIACFAFAGCKKDDTSLEGKYNFSSMTMTVQGETTTVKAGESYMGATINKDYAVLEIKEDGTFTLTAMGQTQSGTWKEEEGTIKLTIDGQTIDAKHEGKTLTLGITDGVTLTLSK